MTPDNIQSRIADAYVAVVTVNYRTPHHTKACVAALTEERAALPQLKVIVVDGGSDDGSTEILSKAFADPSYRDWVSLMPLPINGGFGWANNQAILTIARAANPPAFVHFLNPDARISPGAVVALLHDLITHPRCGAAGSQLLDDRGNLTASSFRFPSIGREFTRGAQSESLGRLLRINSSVVRSDQAAEVDWVTGASVMFRMDALREAGLFDDGFFLYFEEVELMRRLRSYGWSVRHVPDSRVTHSEGTSTGLDGKRGAQTLPPYWYDSRRRYFALWGAATAVGGSLAFAAGRGIAVLKASLLRRPAPGPSAMDLMRNGVLPSRTDRRPSVPSIGDPPGKPPSWMGGK